MIILLCSGVAEAVSDNRNLTHQKLQVHTRLCHTLSAHAKTACSSGTAKPRATNWVVQQHSLLRRVLRMFWGRVLRRALGRGLAMGFSEGGFQKVPRTPLGEYGPLGVRRNHALHPQEYDSCNALRPSIDINLGQQRLRPIVKTN